VLVTLCCFRCTLLIAVLEEGATPTIPRWCDALPSVADTGDDGSTLDSSALDRALPWGWKEDIAYMASLVMQQRQQRQKPLVSSERSDALVGGSEDVLHAFSLLRPATDAIGLATESGSVASAVARINSKDAKDAAQSATSPSQVLGGTDEWRIRGGECNGVLRNAIEACLNRDPDQRPSFADIVELLRVLLDRPASELFLQVRYCLISFFYGRALVLTLNTHCCC
jgi:hypothetical protein